MFSRVKVRIAYIIEWRVLRRAANAFVFWYLKKCLLSEIADGANGRFVKMYESYDKWSAAQDGVFLKTMGRHSAVWKCQQ